MRAGTRSWLMRGRLAEKPYWMRFQKAGVCIALPFVLLAYAGVLVSLMR